jgi:hypothetical protein
MLVVETIGRIRRENLVKGKSIKEIARDLKISRNTVRKILRSGDTSFSYEREVPAAQLPSAPSEILSMRPKLGGRASHATWPTKALPGGPGVLAALGSGSRRDDEPRRENRPNELFRLE